MKLTNKTAEAVVAINAELSTTDRFMLNLEVKKINVLFEKIERAKEFNDLTWEEQEELIKQTDFIRPRMPLITEAVAILEKVAKFYGKLSADCASDIFE